ncbi:hypothetical protein WME75_30755 [Sorangium sp. So ce1014]|uniref:hypothetical protein n=1 Tax=Sorangium sp. So ce1014 TaxID=3133326 RepID=UPI003F628709
MREACARERVAFGRTLEELASERAERIEAARAGFDSVRLTLKGGAPFLSVDPRPATRPKARLYGGRTPSRAGEPRQDRRRAASA